MYGKTISFLLAYLVLGAYRTMNLATILGIKRGLVAHTGFEPVISALRGQRPEPLDECALPHVGHYISEAGKRQFTLLLQ
jgi:hypothetical protein